MDYLMAIDAGTGSIRAVIFDIFGNQIGLAQKEWVHLSQDGVPNSMNFDFKNNWSLVLWCIKNAIDRAGINPKDIKALSASSMREGIVLYDKDGCELWAVANVDARASKEVKELGQNFKGIEEEFYKYSGQTFALGALPRILWLKNNHPSIYEKVDKISMISDWILYKLCGKIASDPSNAGTTGIFSLKDRDWMASMASRVGLKSDIFPPVLQSGEVLGNVQEQEDLALHKDTLVVMGGGDVQLGSAGLGVIDIGDVAVIGGSFWQQIANISLDTKPPADMNIRINPHVLRNQSQAEGITFFSGLVMRWFRDAFCAYEKNMAKQKGIGVYELLEQKAMDVPVGSNGIMPIFSDDMKYKKWYHASPSFLNLSIDPAICNIASMFRSLQENACIVSGINLQKIQSFANIKIDTITLAGGASKGKLWPQILADVTNKRVKIPKIKEATALGGAMAAGVGAGIYSSIKDVALDLVQWEREYIPNKSNYEKYQSITKNWIRAYKAQLKLVDEGIVSSMWRAPGI